MPHPPLSPAKRAKAEALKNEANELFKAKKWEEALSLYEQAAETDPSNIMILCNRAFAHIKLENFENAVADAEQSILLDPTFPKAYYRRATARMMQGKLKLALNDLRKVTRLRPSDAAVHDKLRECEKMWRVQAFGAAIRDDSSSPIESLAAEIDKIQVGEEYDGPRWDEGEMTNAFIQGMLESFKDDKRLHKKYLYKIILESYKQHVELDNIEHIAIPEGKHLTVCGDTHGQFYDVLKIFELNGAPSSENPYVFNGDFVDRGSWSLEVVTTLLAYKCLEGSSMHLTRGNHETVAMNRIYGFEAEVVAKHSIHAFHCFVQLFTHLPLALIINDKVFVTHGGLPTPGTSLDDIQKANRKVEPGDSGIVCDLLWSDPQDEAGRAASKRGTGFMFGPDVSHAWLDANNLELLIRSHEMKEEGYSVDHQGRCITIFSAPNYCDQMGNLGAFIRLAHDCKPHFTTFSAAPHPDVRAMKYAPIMGAM